MPSNCAASISCAITMPSKGEEQQRLFAAFRETCKDAVALNCPMLMSAIGPGTASLDEAVANIAHAGRIAAEFELRLAVEYQFRHPVMTTLDAVRDAVKRADQPSVGLLLDAYHLHRGGRPGAGFRGVPEAEIFYVQYSDVPDAPPNGPPPIDRLPPGKGVVDWTGFFRLLAEKNYTGYFSYEAPNPAQWQKPAADTAREGVEATRRALAKALR
jgi:sugar phosphate isomerase/epimerase